MSKSLNKALKIESGRYLNMDHVTMFTLDDETIQLVCADDLLLYVFIGSQAMTDPTKYYVSKQEFLRIKRELCDYMGIDEPSTLID